MSSSTQLLNPYGNSPYAYGKPPYKKVGLRYHLRRKFALKGFTVSSFAERYSLKWRDVSNFINGRLDRIGRKAKQKIREALVAEGLLKPRKVHPKFPCPACGRLMRNTEWKRRSATDEWLNKRPSAQTL